MIETVILIAGILVIALLAWRLLVSWRVRSGRIVFHLVESGDLELIRHLLNQRPKTIDRRDKEGNSPLHAAAGYSRVEIAQFLIQRGASVESRRNNGCTPLHIAAHNGDLAMLKTLIGAGADVNAESAFGLTPLHMAVGSDKPAAVRLLLDNGANESLRDDRYKMTPRELALHLGDPETVRVFGI